MKSRPSSARSMGAATTPQSEIALWTSCGRITLSIELSMRCISCGSTSASLIPARSFSACPPKRQRRR
eukprot:2538040-Rhodomonas_salina.1